MTYEVTYYIGYSDGRQPKATTSKEVAKQTLRDGHDVVKQIYVVHLIGETTITQSISTPIYRVKDV